METLDKIVMDILRIARGSSVVQSETISTRQIEDWVNQYRSMLITQKVEKKYDLNSSLIQSMNCLELEQVDKAECCSLGFTTCNVLRTKLPLPKFVMSKVNGELITFVGKITGEPIQLMSETRTFFSQYRKFTKRTIVSYKKNGYIYILNDDAIEKITVRGVLEDPRAASEVISSCTSQPCYSLSDPYPITSEMIPTVRNLILTKELGMTLSSTSDKKNDSSSTTTPNTYQTN